MREIARILTVLLICKTCAGQFFYNYEAEEPSHLQASGEVYDPSQYQYVPPSAVEERYSQPQSGPQPLQNSDNLRRRSGSTQRVDVADVISEDQYHQQQPLQPQNVETDFQPQEEPRSNKRNSNRRQRQRARNTSNRDLRQSEMRQPQKQYAPSVFENIGLGEAPSGVNVPEDSLLNILRSNNPNNYNQPQPRRVQQAPSIQYTASQPSREQYYSQQTQPQLNFQNIEPIRHNRGPRQQVEVAEAPPEEQYYKQQLPQTQNAQRDDFETEKEIRSSRRNVRRQRVSSGNTWNGSIKQIEVLQPQRQYASSVFANIELGEAPTGVDVPEDSLLNILRTNSRAVRYSQPQHISQASTVQRVISPQQSRRTLNSQYTDIQETQSLSYENQRTSNERSPTQQFYAQPPASSEQLHQNTPDRYAAYPQSELHREIPRNTQRHRQQPSPRPAQTSRQQRKHDGAVRRRAPQPPQTVYEVPEQQKDVKNNADYEDDIVRQRPPNSNRRPRQQVNPSQNLQFDHQTTSAPFQKAAFKTANLAIAALPDDTDEDGIPGQARADYPTLHVIPTTSFSCAEQPHSGYYADLETSCQVVHLCQAGGVQSSFLCPNGTIFSQEKFSCQWWYKVDCANSPKFYGINDSLYKVPPPPSRKKNT